MDKLQGISDADLRAELDRRAEEKRQRFIYPESPVGWWRVTTEGDCEGKSVTNLGTHYGHICEIALGLAGAAYYALDFHEAPEPAYTTAPRDCAVISAMNLANIASNTINEIEMKKLAAFFGPGWRVTPGNSYQSIKVSKV